MRKLIALGLVLLLSVLISACTIDSTTNTTYNDTSEETSMNIYADENISVDFITISNSAVDGNFELYIKTQNNTGKNITVYLKDVTLNDSVVEVGSGVPCDIAAGTSRTHGFFGRLDLAGISSAEKVEKITFKVWVVDDNFDTIITTTDLVIEK